MSKIITAIAMVVASVLAVILLLNDNFDWAIFCITILFTLTNGIRSFDMAAKGFEKESAWMRNVAILFAVASAAILVVNLFL